jgi:hypothetical protein
VIRLFGSIIGPSALPVAELPRASGPDHMNRRGQDVMGELVKTAWSDGIDPETLLRML